MVAEYAAVQLAIVHKWRTAAIAHGAISRVITIRHRIQAPTMTPTANNRLKANHHRVHKPLHVQTIHHLPYANRPINNNRNNTILPHRAKVFSI